MPTKNTARYRLKLSRISFLSVVDRPAMEPATISLIKSEGEDDAAEIALTARIVKASDELVWGWAFVSQLNGEPYVDLQGDILDEESMLEVAKDFMSGARALDTQHDERATGEVVFGLPMTADIAKAFGIETTTHGFMVAVRPAPDVMAKIKDGTYTGFSLGGLGTREPIGKRGGAALKAAALTAAADGHQHLIDLDRQAGETSYAQTLAGVGHCHPYTIADGVVTIGMAAGHTHEASAGSKPADPAEPAAKAAPETMLEYFNRLNLGAEDRIRIARLNAGKGVAWADAIVKVATTGELNADVLDARTVEVVAAHAETVAKAAEEAAIEKAIGEAARVEKAAHDRLYARVAAIAKAQKLTRGEALLVALEHDEEGLAAYRALKDARAAARPGAVRAERMRKAAQSKIDSATTELHTMAEDHALRFNVTHEEARLRLPEISKRARELREVMREARDEIGRADTVAAQIEGARAQERAELRKRQEVERITKEAEVAHTAIEKALAARYAEIATERRCSTEEAVAWGLEHCDVVLGLRKAVKAERQRRAS